MCNGLFSEWQVVVTPQLSDVFAALNVINVIQREESNTPEGLWRCVRPIR